MLSPGVYDDIALATVRGYIKDNPGAEPGDKTVTLKFQPGTYELEERLDLPWGTPSDRELELIATDPDQPPVLLFRPPTTNPGFWGAKPEQFFMGLGWETWMLYFVGTQPQPLERFEAHNLILDANWPAWAVSNTPANPAYTSGFALGALRVQARQGTIQNVHVQNSGANGITPSPYWSPAGRECFPLVVEATEFGSNLWTIEDCEVSEFHSTHGGYCTAVMVKQEDVGLAEEQPQVRVATVRRCQVRGNRHVIAFGSAKSAGVTYSDNVVLNAGTGLNHDTGSMRNFDFVNNILLDVGMLGNIGGALWGTEGFVNYWVEDNAVRLRGVPLNQDYRSYQWQENTIGTFTTLMPVTDPDLPIGRLETGYSAGLKLAGTSQIHFNNNRFTTRLRADFYEPLPGGGNVNNARWTPVFKPTEDPTTHRTCTQSGSFAYTGNSASSIAMDFAFLDTIPGGDLIGATAANLPAINDPPSPPSGFVPDAWPGRVGTTASTGSLDYVEEVQIGRPQVIAGGDIEFLARWVRHPTGATPAESSEPLGAATFAALECIVTDPAQGVANITATQFGNWARFSFTPTAGSGAYRLVVFNAANQALFDPDGSVWSWTEFLHGTTVRLERAADVADDRRLHPATLRLSRSGSTSNPLVVLLDRVTDGTGIFRPAQPDVDYTLRYAGSGTPITYANDAYSVTIQAYQSEVSVEVVPRNDPEGQRDVAEYEVAYFRVLEGAGYAVAPPATDTTATPGTDVVALTFWDGPKYRLHELSYAESAGSSSMAGGPEPGLVGEEALTLEEALLLELLSIESDLESPSAGTPEGTTAEEEAIIGELIAEGVLPEPVVEGWYAALAAELGGAADLEMSGGTGAALPGVSTGGSAPSSGPAPTYTTALAINNLFSGETPVPQISGGAVVFGTNYTAYAAGWWDAPDYDDLQSVAAAVNCVFYDVDEFGNLFGSIGSYPRYYDASAEEVKALPALLGAPNDRGFARAACPLGDYVAGYALDLVSGHYYWRPVRWVWNGVDYNVHDLGGVNGDLACTGFAEDVRDDGTAVGWMFYAPEAAYRAFRTPPAPGYITTINDLLPLVPKDPDAPEQLDLVCNTARAINAGGEVVGSSDTHYKYWNVQSGEYEWEVQTRAAFWKSTGGSGFSLGVLQPDLGGGSPLNPTWSEAYGINQREYGATVVGAGYATPTGEPRAFVCDVSFQTSGGTLYPGKMLNLNDPHVTLIEGSGWQLRQAEGINDEGWIVGNGYLGGLWRGFVLVPYTIAEE